MGGVGCGRVGGWRDVLPRVQHSTGNTMKVFVVLALLAAVAAAQDPAGSWLSYTEYDAPGM